MSIIYSQYIPSQYMSQPKEEEAFSEHVNLSLQIYPRNLLHNHTQKGSILQEYRSK